jgi:hypothetical protein
MSVGATVLTCLHVEDFLKDEISNFFLVFRPVKSIISKIHTILNKIWRESDLRALFLGLSVTPLPPMTMVFGHGKTPRTRKLTTENMKSQVG